MGAGATAQMRLGPAQVETAYFPASFIVQWIASERSRRSVIPVSFWYYSIGGGLTLLAYSIYRLDPVFIVGQGAGLFIYARNLHLIHRSPGHPTLMD